MLCDIRSSPLGIANCAELVCHSVVQRVVRPDFIVPSTELSRLLRRILHGFELGRFQELAMQSTAKRFDVSIFPGASPGYRNRLRPEWHGNSH
jgi:hypothetical protein